MRKYNSCKISIYNWFILSILFTIHWYVTWFFLKLPRWILFIGWKYTFWNIRNPLGEWLHWRVGFFLKWQHTRKWCSLIFIYILNRTIFSSTYLDEFHLKLAISSKLFSRIEITWHHHPMFLQIFLAKWYLLIIFSAFRHLNAFRKKHIERGMYLLPSI